ncbi:CDGSH iron-sulfur domain-containing protein [Methanolobus sp. ZRKC3]|uniref:CDGSH iron-sulfur domain-containing protein n=1 Tax=Methanolobus sp. ZRKC3 TaxID=3125786 RepID=UPI0032484590
MGKEDENIIEVSKDGPYVLNVVMTIRNSKGIFIEKELTEEQPNIALCRCGGSTDKPFCTGAHVDNGFTGEKQEDRVPDKVDTYKGKNITIHDNRGVCSHIGHCSDNLPSVFRMDTEPWIDPDGAEPEEIAKVIRMCPSGALSYTMDGELHKEYPHEPEIFVGKDRPYQVVGKIKLDDPDGSTPETQDHYTLCRCGSSKNKPFCDGSHWYVEFKDEKN